MTDTTEAVGGSTDPAPDEGHREDLRARVDAALRERGWGLRVVHLPGADPALTPDDDNTDDYERLVGPRMARNLIATRAEHDAERREEVRRLGLRCYAVDLVDEHEQVLLEQTAWAQPAELSGARQALADLDPDVADQVLEALAAVLAAG